ncbi:response regulator [Ketobacter sp.]|uniref:response regulator n=1 Tax=Ketobacter sp. TaxID=2083498 RepID=UPI000F2C85C2|nr:response regulator [Ketobacter sp.]RLU00217.1 MAG: response regulator [Ketobacter sp.]
MSNKLALVVDDSRMARHVLSKMLTEQGIDVDSVESGEEALGYLCGKKPSMIFMDHTMPGMDGFQCLRAIKNDPLTAAIPIIMYTSKEGEVYESQARALGAVDVLPKTLKPLMLAQVLERQNLLPNQVGASRAAPQVGQAANDVVIVDNEPKPEPVPAPRPAPKKPEEHPELDALEQRIEQLTSQLQGMSQQSEASRNRGFRFQYLGLALCVVLIGWLLLSNNRLMQELTVLQSDNRSLEDTVRLQTQQNEAMRAELNTQLDAQVKINDNHNRQFYESIEWALNEDGQFAWDEKPFNDRLAMTLSQLAQNLSSVGFVGEIAIRSHLGRFCLVTAPNGETQLPEADATLSTCEILQFTPALAESTGTEQTPGFERFLAAFQSEYGDDIELNLSTAGDRRPVARYASQDPDASAERWNKTAARNQRIEISINPY